MAKLDGSAKTGRAAGYTTHRDSPPDISGAPRFDPVELAHEEVLGPPPAVRRSTRAVADELDPGAKP